MDKPSVDFDGMLKQAYDIGMIAMITSLAGTEEEKEVINKTLKLFYKYGVRPEDSMKLLIELMETFGTEGEVINNE